MGLVRSSVRCGSSRSARALYGWILLALLALLATTAWDGGEAALAQPEPDLRQLEQGAAIYAANCAACHGARGAGGPAEEGLTAGPPLAGIDRAYVDQQMRTGRMPIVDRTAGVVRPLELSDGEREAVLAWMIDELELTGEIPEVGEGDATRGQELYTVHCAACHGSVGNGGISGGGVQVLGLRGVDAVAMAEAMRVGPYEMPAFGEDLLDEEEVNDIAAFTSAFIEEPQRSLLGLTEQNRVGLSVLALLLLGLVVGGAMLVARDVPLPVAREDARLEDAGESGGRRG